MNDLNYAAYVGAFCTSNHGVNTPPKGQTHDQSSKFPRSIAHVLLDTAISVAEAGVRLARNQKEHDEAMYQLRELHKQRTCAHLNDRIHLDNLIQDRLHEQLDAQRTSGGVTLDAYLAGQG